MQLFIRTDRTLSLQAEPLSTVLALKSQLRERHDVPETEQRLVYAGRQLVDGQTLQECGIERDATLHLALRLCGGKGGFGALLRAGGRSSVNQNTDACRDLSGRRLRHVNADKKLQEWAADAKERELEKIALQHIKAEAKAAERAQRTEVDVDAVRSEHREGMASVKETMDEMVSQLPRRLKRDVGPPAAQGPVKRARLFADSLSDSDSEESDAEELPALAVSAEAPAAPSALPAEAAAAAPSRLAVDTTTAAAPDRQASVTSPKQAMREQSVASNGSSASAATASAAVEAGSPGGGGSSGMPAASEGGSSGLAELDWAAYDSPEALQALELEELKARLAAAGLKCGGSLQERAARLFLLKDTPADKLDRKHFAKPSKKK